MMLLPWKHNTGAVTFELPTNELLLESPRVQIAIASDVLIVMLTYEY